MNWNPKECSPGNLIRVRLGSVCHYGIFLDEAHVIQFGLPPVPEYALPPEQIVVCSSGIDVFACGRIVEVAEYTKKENRTRFSDAEIIERAKSRLGTGGYNLLHNNCEHFVYECAFGKPYCSVEAEALERWRKRPVFDLYVMPDGSDPEPGETSCAKRSAFPRALAETALNHSFRMEPGEIRFRRARSGARTADGMRVSFARAGGYTAVAVSNRDCGIEMRALPGRGETDPENALSSLAGRMKRQCVRKQSGRLASLFRGETGSGSGTRTVRLEREGLLLTFCGENIAAVKYYRVCDRDVTLIADEMADIPC